MIIVMKFVKTWLILLLVVVGSGQIFAQDVSGSKDHPLITRFPGSKIINYDERTFDEYRMVNKKVANAVITNPDEKNSFRVEGKITEIVYEIGKEKSTLEVFENYRQALKKSGFKSLFECNNEACGSGGRESAFVKGINLKSVILDFLADKDHRYLTGKLLLPQGTAYFSVYTMRSERGRILTKLAIIETKEIETGLITVNAEAMRQSITTNGRVALYGIYFDTNKTEIKPESQAALEEIAKLLRSDTTLRLIIVGHTDNVGTFEFNMDLSKRRAEAVVNALVTQYGIQSSRLKSTGVSYSSPVASNRTEEGRAKNRRVELVEQ